jgi:hydrogenase-4 component B
MGIYGLVRVTSILPNPPVTWGAILLVLGAASGILGVAYAIGQHDIKRLLAYHSVENIGLIVMGVGLALLGRTMGRIDWVFCGMAGALLHVWNHALFKSLLFLGAGSVIHATRSKEIDHLGGLAKAMPATAFCFLVGAVAICGLPPLNGFVSEFLIYLGLFRTLGIGGGPSLDWAALAAPALALIGALAIACFVKVYGTVFLGSARTEHAIDVRESPLSMVAPMFALCAICAAIGLAPVLVSEILRGSAQTWIGDSVPLNSLAHELVPWGWLTLMAGALLAALLIGGVLLRRRMSLGTIEFGATWGCGYPAASPRMQYTSSSFGQLLVGMFAWALRPKWRRPETRALFPQPAPFRSEVEDVLLEDGMLPAFRFTARLFGWFRILQQGSVQAYLLYIVLTLLALFLWRW